MFSKNVSRKFSTKIQGIMSPRCLGSFLVPGMTSLLSNGSSVQLNSCWLPPRHECYYCTFRVFMQTACLLSSPPLKSRGPTGGLELQHSTLVIKPALYTRWGREKSILLCANKYMNKSISKPARKFVL